MADEKKTTSDLDDWLEDLDDAEEFSGELNQENIDALLSGGLQDDAAAPPEPEAPAANASVELDQANIDALLGAGLDIEEKEAAPAQEAPAGDAPMEMDQANIDAMLSGGAALAAGDEAKPAQTPPAEVSVELDQANIDALLGGLEESPGQQAGAAPAPQDASGGVELDQANIDLLLGAEDDGSPAGAGELDQDNIDALLSGAGKEEKAAAADAVQAAAPVGQAGPGEGLDVDQDEIDQLFSGLDEDEIEEPFPAEEMDLANVLASDDDFEEVGDAAQANKTSAGEATVAGEIDAMNHEDPARNQGTGGFLPFLPAALNRTVATVIAVCLAVLVASGVYFFRSGPKKEPAIPVPSGEPVAQVEEPQPQEAAVNHAPVVADSLYTMPEAGGEVQVPLTAKDDDGDTVTYEVASQPQHGRLSGEAPALVYLPNNDFPGEDRFEYKASDGKESSALAKVIISGPNLAKLTEEKQKAEAAKKSTPPARKPQVFARNMTYDTASTGKLIIDWGRIWREANRSPFNSRVLVDIDDSHLSGSLSKVDDGKYVYRPDPAFSGKDVLHYRFKQGGLSSGLGQVTIRVSRGDLPPEIRLGEMAGTYMVGETVRIDASPTRDEARSSLSFRWEQVAGTPVQMKMNNAEGSAISFAMPASFYSSADPGPVLRVTAVDAAGQSAAKEVKVRTISRRKSALWGMADNGERGRVGLR